MKRIVQIVFSVVGVVLLSSGVAYAQSCAVDPDTGGCANGGAACSPPTGGTCNTTATGCKCLAGTAFGGDDQGLIPSDAPKGPHTKCEAGVAKGVGKLVAALITCHSGRATGKLANAAAEETCEASAITKFMSTKTAGCEACIDLSAIASFTANVVDSSNAVVFCGSPSGAFLGGLF